MQVGTTRDQGLYSKPTAAVHPGALAAGTLPQYNTITWCHSIWRLTLLLRITVVASIQSFVSVSRKDLCRGHLCWWKCLCM